MVWQMLTKVGLDIAVAPDTASVRLKSQEMLQ